MVEDVVVEDSMMLMSREPVKYSREDEGFTLRYTLTDPRFDDIFSVVLQSHEENDKRLKPKHTIARELAGKRIRVIIEVLN